MFWVIMKMCYCFFFSSGVLLTGAGVVEELRRGEHPVRRWRQEKWTPGLYEGVVNLLLQLLLGDLRLWVEEDQLPPPPLPRLYFRRRHTLSMGEEYYRNTTGSSVSL